MKHRYQCPYCKHSVELSVVETERVTPEEKKELVGERVNSQTIPYERFRDVALKLKKYKDKYGDLPEE